MGTITAYSISVALILAIEYLVYKCLLANATFYRFNRAVIIGCYIMALVAQPLVHATAKISGTAAVSEAAIASGISLGQLTSVITADGNGSPDSSAIFRIIPILYFAGMGVMLLLSVISYLRIARIIARGEKRRIDGAVLVVSNSKVSPFSWGKYLVVSPADADNPIIINHELTHIRNHHSLDLIMARLFIIFNWYNPAAYLMCRELTAVHEYDVDREILQSGIKADIYQMLLIRKTVGPGFQSIANSLNHSQLKNRLTMMLKSKSKGARYLCAGALLPAALLAAAMTDIPAVASTIDNVAGVSYDKVTTTAPSFQENEQSIMADAKVSASEETPVKVAEVMPKYPGGELEMLKAIMYELKYPEKTQKEGVSGRVIIQFVVNTDGTMSDYKIMKSSGSEELDAEALRGLKEGLTEKWTPGMSNGKPVRCSYTLPVNFALTDDK